jgi:hypothetical protein
MTELELHVEGLTETVLHLNFGYFVLFCFVFLFVLLFVFSPLIRHDKTTSEKPSPGLQAEGLTPKLLRLKLYCIELGDFCFFFIVYLSL